MVKRGLMLAAIMVACLSLAGRSFGSDDVNADVIKRLQALEEKNKELEAKLQRAEARPSSTAAVDRAVAAEEAKMSSVITDPDPNCRPLKIGGYFDVSYEYNFNRPKNQQNNFRVFDKYDAQGFDVHLASLNFSRLPEKPGQAGFRLDVDWGTDLRTYQSADGVADNVLRFGQDNNGTNNTIAQFMETDMRQAYIEYIVPIGCGDRGITIDAGKFVTWAGAEVIQASDNMNASRSYLFGYAIPFTHTGMRATYDVLKSDCGVNWTVGLGVVNGWDNVQDTNREPTAMFMSDLKPTKWFDWTLVGIVGNEGTVDQRALLRTDTAVPTLVNPNGGNNAGAMFSDLTDPTILGNKATAIGTNFQQISGGSPRGLVDTTLTFTPWEKFTFVLNGDFGEEKQGSNASNRWWGGALYVKYQFAKDWYFAARGEYFADDDGSRTGRRADYSEVTATVDWALSDPLHVRFEYRHDHANEELFDSPQNVSNTTPNFGDPFRRHQQDTVMMQWLYKF